MPVLHRAAGLIFATDRPVPGLPICASPRPADVFIHLDRHAPWRGDNATLFHRADGTDARGRPLVTVHRHERGFHFRYADGTDIWLTHEAADVWAAWDPAATLEDAATYLTGPILGFLLRLRGSLALHASAVQVGPGAVGFVGAHGAGKSTTAAALARRGCAVVTDDVLRLRPERTVWLAEPFGGALRLWPEGAALAIHEDIALPPLTPTWNKRALAMGTHDVSCASRARPLRALVFLEPRDGSGGGPRLAPIAKAEALVRLATHSSASHLLDAGERAREFQALSRLLPGIRCVRAIAGPAAAFGQFIDLIHAWAVERRVAHAR